MFNDSITMTGRVQLILVDQNGTMVDYKNVNNLVVTAGKQLVASRLINSGTAPSHIGIGASNTPSALAQTGLIAEATRVACSSSATGAVALMTSTFAPGVGTGVIQEAGIFNAASAGIMLSRVAFGSITKSAGDTLIINWYITVN